MTYNNSGLTNAQLEAIDEGRGYAAEGPTLPALRKVPATAAAIAQARAAHPAAFWFAQLGRPFHDSGLMGEPAGQYVRAVWRTMPGNTCFDDALRAIAYAKEPQP